MATSQHPKQLSGLARSIRGLFDREMAVEPTPAPDPTPSVSEDTVLWALETALNEFLATPPVERVTPTRGLRDAVVAAEEAGHLDAIVDVLRQLINKPWSPTDATGVTVSRRVASPKVVDRLVERLGSERDEVIHEDLLKVCSALPEQAARALGKALSETEDRFARRSYLTAVAAMGSEALEIAESMAKDDRWFVVRNGLTLLAEHKGPRSVDLASSALGHEVASVRREALLTLAKLGDRDSGALVVGMLDDPDPSVHSAAITACGALKAVQALDRLLAILEHPPEPDVVPDVLRALGHVGDDRAVEAIEKHAVGSFFHTPPTDVRVAAYGALHRIDTPEARRLVEAARDDRDEEVRTAVQRFLSQE
ncbi:MAG: HEAT repeat domain-containing protein [Gemmatimonadota bacterium]|nr:HEAT repeat domain-containing protein [Gemmatimonadota bacterium]MDH5760629.1 HEAT repeat domain-containing protein [Gemmatimonadota bacterium]